jgi:hypothetical protein
MFRKGRIRRILGVRTSLKAKFRIASLPRAPSWQFLASFRFTSPKGNMLTRSVAKNGVRRNSSSITRIMTYEPSAETDGGVARPALLNDAESHYDHCSWHDTRGILESVGRAPANAGGDEVEVRNSLKSRGRHLVFPPFFGGLGGIEGRLRKPHERTTYRTVKSTLSARGRLWCGRRRQASNQAAARL